METRGRGREARASTDETPSSTAQAPAARNNSPPQALEPPSTRSRTRQRASTALPRAPVSRNTRASASASACQPQPTQIVAVPTTHSRLRRLSTPRCSGDSTGPSTPTFPSTPGPVSSNLRGVNSSSAVAAPSSARPPATRKRTRSSSRRSSAIPSTSALPSSASANAHLQATSAATNVAASSAAVTTALSARPWKRPRRSVQGNRHSRNTPHLSNVARAITGGPSSRRGSRDMDSSNNSNGGSDGRDVEPVSQSRDVDGPSSLGSDRTGANTLQGLLRRLGADLSEIFPTTGATSHARLQQLRSSITSPESNEQQIDALSELCEFLSVGTEESLVSFSVNLFVGPLVNLLRTGSNIEIKIYAARALTHMMEALPSSSSTIANHGAAGPLCQNLLSIEYIDLAEQSLSALHKLSVDYPQQIVSANGFQAVLSFIDFFSLGVQRVAAATACNMCRLPRAEAMDMISGVLPIMMRLLDSEDQRIRESAVLGFTRLAESFRSASEKLESLCGDQAVLVEKVLGLIVPPSPPALAPHSYSSALRLLAILSRGSSNLGLQILGTQPLILKLKLSLSSGATMHAVDCLHLADSLLPDVPESDGTQGPVARSRRRRSVGSTAAFAAVDTKRREELTHDMTPLTFFGQSLFSTMMKFYVSCADSGARRLALSVMAKFISIAPESVLFDVISNKEHTVSVDAPESNGIWFCPFVAALLGENSSRSETLAGLVMANSALQKLPSLRESFVREGVVHEVVRLAAFDSGAGVNDDEDTTAAAVSNVEAPGTTVGSSLLADSARGTNEEAVVDNSNARSTDSVWAAVAAFQRGSWQRGLRGDFVLGSQRYPARPLDIRVPEQSSLQSLIPEAARSILNDHLGAEEDGKVQENVLNNSILSSLNGVGSLLATEAPGFVEHRAIDGLSKLVDLLIAPQRLTVFEVSKSGLMEALARFLTPQSLSLMRSRRYSLVQRLNDDNHQHAFSSLVDLALGVLASEEKLPIQTNDSSTGTASASVSSGLRQLAQPFKLRLRKASSEEGGANLRDYSHHVVLIEPLATMGSVQEFLWPKVRQLDRGATSKLPSSSRRRAAQTRGVGMALAPGSQNAEDSQHFLEDGNHIPIDVDENSYADEGMFDMDDDNHDDEDIVDDDDDDEQHSDPSDGEVSSGEEDVIEQDGGESDENDVEGAESFDVDQLGSPLPPFELDHDSLGQAPLRGRRLGGIGRETFGRAGPAARLTSDHTTTFRSYAAALAANMPKRLNRISVSSELNRDAQRQEPVAAHAEGMSDLKPSVATKLSFVLNGKAISHDSSILSAVMQSNAEGRGIGSRLWSDVHTLVYAKSTEAEEDSGAESAKVPQGATCDENRASESVRVDTSAGPVRRSLRLQENRGKSDDSPSEKSSATGKELSAELLAKVCIDNSSIPMSHQTMTSSLPRSIASVIDVLKQLHWIYQKLNDRMLRLHGVPGSIEGLKEDSNVVFISDKLKAKLLRQLSDPLALCGGVIPAWCFSLSRDASFLLPFEARRILFQSTALGVARALHQLLTRVDVSGTSTASHRPSRGHRDSEARVGRIQRQKVRLHRNRILESAIKVISMYGAHSTVLEVQYFDEAGTGLGPTLEFYTLASREIQRVDLGLWRGTAVSVPKEKGCSSDNAGTTSAATNRSRNTPSRPAGVKRRSRRHSQNTGIPQVYSNTLDEDDSPSYVNPTGSGLFPSCLPIVLDDSQKDASAKTTALFGFVGRLLGKAVIDARLLDLRFSKTFSRLLLAYCRVLYESVKSTDVGNDENSSLSRVTKGGAVAAELWDANREAIWDMFTSGVTAMSLLEDVDPQLASSLKAVVGMVRNGQGDLVEMLALTFVLPGDDEMELIEGGKDVAVTGQNAEEFVKRVTYHVLYGGVQLQAEALLHGLSEVLDITSLLAFECHELELMICGPSFESWTIDFLVQATRCDHGYSHESPAVLYFLRILSEMNQQDQQRFVLFATGSPALPLGGLRSLHPKLTIVRRTPEVGRSPDECLPTVMTCTNYFKLPEYSSFEIAKKQTMYAVREGQGSFHLS